MSVWATVAELQEAMASHLRKQSASGLASVRAAASPTSLMLTQTSPPVEKAVSAYSKALSGVANGKTGVVGYAFAVDGDVKSADIYASPELFSAMWPKLLKSSAIEAVRVRKEGRTAAVEASQVKAFLCEADRGKETTREVDRRTRLVNRASESQVWVESQDGTNWVHRSVVKK